MKEVNVSDIVELQRGAEISPRQCEQAPAYVLHNCSWFVGFLYRVCHLCEYSLFFVLFFNRHIFCNCETRRLEMEETQKTVSKSFCTVTEPVLLCKVLCLCLEWGRCHFD